MRSRILVVLTLMAEHSGSATASPSPWATSAAATLSLAATTLAFATRDPSATHA